MWRWPSTREASSRRVQDLVSSSSVDRGSITFSAISCRQQDSILVRWASYQLGPVGLMRGRIAEPWHEARGKGHKGPQGQQGHQGPEGDADRGFFCPWRPCCLCCPWLSTG